LVGVHGQEGGAQLGLVGRFRYCRLHFLGIHVAVVVGVHLLKGRHVKLVPGLGRLELGGQRPLLGQVVVELGQRHLAVLVRVHGQECGAQLGLVGRVCNGRLHLPGIHEAVLVGVHLLKGRRATLLPGLCRQQLLLEAPLGADIGVELGQRHLAVLVRVHGQERGTQLGLVGRLGNDRLHLLDIHEAVLVGVHLAEGFRRQGFRAGLQLRKPREALPLKFILILLLLLLLRGGRRGRRSRRGGPALPALLPLQPPHLVGELLRHCGQVLHVVQEERVQALELLCIHASQVVQLVPQCQHQLLVVAQHAGQHQRHGVGGVAAPAVMAPAVAVALRQGGVLAQDVGATRKLLQLIGEA